MGSESTDVQSDQTDSMLLALASRRRRYILATLADESTSVPVWELATHVAAAVEGTSFVSIESDGREREHVALVHRELPKLADAGLVEWNREDSAVTTTDHPALSDPQFKRVIDSPDEDWDDVLESLADDRRRTILSILVDCDSPLGQRDLARLTAARECDVSASDVSPNVVDDVVASLHHIHLPKLRGAGLLVDDGPESIQYAGHPDIDEESLTVESNDCTSSVELVAG